jgi:hypothetical protein
MSFVKARPAVLTAHPSTPRDAVRALAVWVRAEEPVALVFEYSLDADMSRVRVPAPGAGVRADGLWKHTCFEAFLAPADAPGVGAPGVDAPRVAAPGVDAPGVDAPGVDAPGVDAPGVEAPGVEAPSYHEFNFSPSRDWGVYRFSAYREGMSPAQFGPLPQISVHRREAGLELEARVHLGALAGLRDARRLRVALAAVIEDEEGRLSYWALRHAAGKPDFHHPSAFALEVALA